MKIKYYDKEGNPRGHSEREEGSGFLAVVVLIALIGFGFVWLWEIVSDWRAFSVPYNYVAAFYNYFVLEPLRVFGYIWDWSQNAHLTSYKNMNITLSVLFMFMYLLLVILSLKSLHKNSTIARTIMSRIPAFMVAPFLLSILWLCITTVYEWLFHV